MDTAKYRNALHELVLNYAVIHPADRPAKLHLKFIDILTVLLQSGLDINDADYRSVLSFCVGAACQHLWGNQDSVSSIHVSMHSTNFLWGMFSDTL